MQLPKRVLGFQAFAPPVASSSPVPVGVKNSVGRAAVAFFVAVVVALSARAESPSIEVRWKGKGLKFSPSDLDNLRVGVERLAEGSWYAESSKLPDSSDGLAIVVRYPSGHKLEVKTHPSQVVQARQVTLYATDGNNDGWPTLFASSEEGTWFLAKHSGPLALDLLCSPQLEQYAPRAVRKNCHLAPSRQRNSD